MLKKSASFVLASFRSSTGTRPPHRLGGAHRRGAPYSSHRAPQRVRLGPSLAAALPNGLFEHPAGVFSSLPLARAIEFSSCKRCISASSQRREIVNQFAPKVAD